MSRYSSRDSDRDRDRGKPDLDCKIYVGDLARDANERDVERAFSYYGRLRSVWVARNPAGFAFVEFEDPRDADDAVRALDGTNLCGARIRVEHSTGKVRPKPWLRGGRGPPRGRGRPFDPADRCYECGGRGHYAYDCSQYRGGRRDRDRDRGSHSRRSREPHVRVDLCLAWLILSRKSRQFFKQFHINGNNGYETFEKEDIICGESLLNLNNTDLEEIFKKRGSRAKFRGLLQKLKDNSYKPTERQLLADDVIEIKDYGSQEPVKDTNKDNSYKPTERQLLVEDVIEIKDYGSQEPVKDTNKDNSYKPTDSQLQVDDVHEIKEPFEDTNKKQQTMLKFLSGINEIEYLDKYSMLRTMKCHVYEDREIKTAQPIRAEYLKFWNEQCLKFAKQGKKKEEMEYLVKKMWNGTGRFDAYVKIGKDVSHLHKLAVDWDKKYSEQYKLKAQSIKDLEILLTVEEDSLRERCRKGTITKSDKKSKYVHIEKIKSDISLENALLNKIAKNWTNQINIMKKNGPSQKTRGRKRKNLLSEVNFKTAKQLKLPKDDNELEDDTSVKAQESPNESEDDNSVKAQESPNESEDDNSVKAQESQNELDDPSVKAQKSPNDIIDDPSVKAQECPPPTVRTNHAIREDGKESSFSNTFHTEGGLNVLIPGLCQNTVDSETGSSACVGIALLILKSILKEENSLNDTNLLKLYREQVKLGYYYWQENNLSTMDVKTALKLPILQDLTSLVEIEKDIIWHNQLKIDGYESGMDALNNMFELYEKRGIAGAFVITADSKSFIIVFDQEFNIRLFDSHLHFLQNSFDSVLKRKDCHGLIVSTNRDNNKELIKYIFATVLPELQANDRHGNIIVLVSKNM